jgi:Methyltransferase domain
MTVSVSPQSRVDRVDMSLFDQIEGACASYQDRRALLAVHAALAARGEFGYLEVGSYHGASLQSFIVDPRCRSIVSIDRRDAVSPDERPGDGARYPDNTTAGMVQYLSQVPGADLAKLNTIDGTTVDLDPAGLDVDLCLIDGEHTNAAALRDARSCRRAVRDRGVIVFHDRLIVDRGIQRFLGELSRYRAYPLAHDLFVVEIGVPSLLDDPRVRAQVPRRLWLIVDRLRAIRPVLRLAPLARTARCGYARFALALGAPRRSGRLTPKGPITPETSFEVHTFVNDDSLYARMRESFIGSGFDPGAFVRLTDRDEDPYTAITRIGRASTSRYPILCHQDVFADQGAGAAELLACLRDLDARDPCWVVAGNAGVTRSGRLIWRLQDGAAGSTGESLPLQVVTLDEDFLVFNPSNAPRCSPELREFHLYGADVCLHALASGGSAYVIDFPVTHLGQTTAPGDPQSEYWRVYRRSRTRFIAVWNDRCLFRYVLTPSDTLFMSRSRIIRQLFGSAGAVASVRWSRHDGKGLPVGRIDRLLSRRSLTRPAARG